MKSSSRGRVTELLPHAKSYDLYETTTVNSGNINQDNGIPDSELSSVYFSAINISALQHGLRYGVYNQTSSIIDNQSEAELLVIMRSIYFQHAENKQHNIIQQVRDLNARVLDYSIGTIVKEIRMHKSYQRDISELPTPIPRSINTSSRGTKVLEMFDM